MLRAWTPLQSIAVLLANATQSDNTAVDATHIFLAARSIAQLLDVALDG